jgi:catechol 2,3-dioxygenase-like lactoylglutathione lyase family enzyme
MTKRARFQASSVVFLVSDIAATLRWYESHLGFVADPFPATPPHVFCLLRRDEIVIMLQQLDGYAKPDDYARRAGGVWDAYIDTDDVAGLFAELSANPRVTIARPLCRQPYGQVEFEVRDPNGYVLVFAEPGATS